MLDKFTTYIRDEKLFADTDKLVVAVSGGADSMVLLKLFQQLPNTFCVAHCNFKLRGAESDGEEVFIRDYCAEQGIELFVQQFDTREYAQLEGISIEMAARDLRYAWFEELRLQLQYDYLATAHHRDDLIETMLINLSRGTGIRGLSGIQAKNGAVVRPLLFASREEILAFAAQNELPYKHDSSNDELVYQRNIIRHQLIPLFETLNPSFRKNAAKTAAILKDTAVLYQQKLGEIAAGIKEEEPGLTRFNIEKLKALHPQQSLMFELFHPFGFKAEQIPEIIAALEAGAGKSFFSKTHRLVKDRDALLLTTLKPDDAQRFYIDSNCRAIADPLQMTFEQMAKSSAFRFSTNPLVADFDLSKLQFPLLLKKWEQGEYFRPLGMQNLKKLSDFFIDQKLSIPEKEALWILYSGKKVVWVVGHRIDDRFKITNDTQEVLRISMVSESWKHE
ncbi:tRNA lysidine(34) synthetase TilS [Mangrovibacterium marinum]|uniref:tRNA(Ile)-lysidine synthase n=1 Tax=Mangrovibacterium marinum TaxID=1639118 RepID=A0A2T5C3R5_9BACT|nr:tRNA lysidine(34) synthetase TilS [Mangrovibacterium marinum]PTN09404.1 tRNA(Ile)-lysidine synthase [Mangrovibacterium marinum]